MEIFVESSKTDQLRDGAWVVNACTGSKLCPVAMLERYIMQLVDMSVKRDSYLSRGLVNTKNGQKLRESGSLRGLVLEKLSAIGLNPKDLHDRVCIDPQY